MRKHQLPSHDLENVIIIEGYISIVLREKRNRHARSRQRQRTRTMLSIFDLVSHTITRPHERLMNLALSAKTRVVYIYVCKTAKIYSLSLESFPTRIRIGIGDATEICGATCLYEFRRDLKEVDGDSKVPRQTVAAVEWF